MVWPTEEVIEPDLVEAGRGCIRRDVAADTHAGALRAMDHHRRVPANDLTNAVLGGLIAREHRLPVRGNGVDVIGAAKARYADIEFGRAAKQLQHEVAGPAIALALDYVVQGADPLGRLIGVHIDVLGGQATCQQGFPVTCCTHDGCLLSAGIARLLLGGGGLPPGGVQAPSWRNSALWVALGPRVRWTTPTCMARWPTCMAR